MTPRLALIALMTLPLAACDGFQIPGIDAASPEPVGHRGPPTISPVDQPIETGAEGRPLSTAEASTYNTAAFSARGNEPFWAVDAAGGTAIYKTPENQRGQPIRVNRLNFAEGVEYIGVQGGRPFSLNIRAAQCTDTMSGERFPFTARLTISGRTQAGCAGPATADIAQAVAATRAPAPAAPRSASQPAAARPAAARPAPARSASEPRAPAAEEAATTTTAPAPAPAANQPATPPSAAGTPAPEAPAAGTPATAAPGAAAPASEGTADLPPPPAAGNPAPDAEPSPAVPTPATPSAPGASNGAASDTAVN